MGGRLEGCAAPRGLGAFGFGLHQLPVTIEVGGAVRMRRRSVPNGDRLRFGAVQPELFNEESTTY